MDYTTACTQLVVVLAVCVTVCNTQTESVKFAICRLSSTSGSQPIEGTIYLKQKISSYGNGTSEGTEIRVYLKGFGQSSAERLRGFHVHDSGDLGRACLDAGAHYNPFNNTHGGPADIERHVGDLGNIKVTIDGTVSQTIIDQQVSLVGPYSVINRAFVVHSDTDDLGKGSFNDSLTTGHAGTRIGCCVIVESTQAANAAIPNPSMAPTNHRASYKVLPLAALTILVYSMLSYF